MRYLLAGVISLLGSCLAVAGTLSPLTAKEIGLMLRSGYSSETILNDLAARHFAGPLDGNSESELVKANASPALMQAIKSGSVTASSDELMKAQQRAAAASVAAQKFAQQRRTAAAAEAQAAKAVQSPPTVIIAHQSGTTLQERQQERVARFGVSKLDLAHAAISRNFEREFDHSSPNIQAQRAAATATPSWSNSDDPTLKRAAVNNITSDGNLHNVAFDLNSTSLFATSSSDFSSSTSSAYNYRSENQKRADGNTFSQGSSWNSFNTPMGVDKSWLSFNTPMGVDKSYSSFTGEPR